MICQEVISMAGGPGSYVFGEAERKEVMEVLESGYLFRYGSEAEARFLHKVATFEKEFAAHMGAPYCVATTSGTSSLLDCLAAIGVGYGDEVIVPGYTFIASISSIVMSNAVPVLAEIDESLTLDPADVERKITAKTKAILPVHMLGNPCKMDKIMEIAKKYNLYVIEDCCQAVGASYQGKKVGTIGDIGAYSLNWFKTISTGDGGAVVTKDENLYERAFGFHDQGHKPSRMGVEVGNRSIIGMNMRMNEVTGAIALGQIRKLPDILTTLRTKKARLKAQLQDIEGLSFRTINDEEECATLLTLLLPDKATADKLGEKIGSKTIAHSGWHVYNNMEQILEKKTASKLNDAYAAAEYHKNMLPQTDSILERAINISVGVVDGGLGSAFGININSTDEEIDTVAANLRAILKEIL